MYYDSVAKAVIVPDTVKNESKVEQDVHRKQSIEHARAANKLFRSRNYAEAAKSFTRAIQEYPEDPSFYSNRALCYLELGNYDSAITDCTIALRSDPKNIKYLYRKSLALFGVGQVTDAIESLLQIYSLNPSENELFEVEEKLHVFQQSLCESERVALQSHIADVKRQSEGSLAKKDVSNAPKDKKDVAKARFDPFTDPANPMKCQMLWIGNFVGRMASEKELKRLMKPFGRMLNYSLGNKSAYVTMLDWESAAAVLSGLQGQDFYGTTLVVRFKLGGSDAVAGGDAVPPSVAAEKEKSREKSAGIQAVTSEMGSLSVSSKPLPKPLIQRDTSGRSSTGSESNRTLPPPLLPLPSRYSPAPHRTLCLEPLPDACNEEDLWNIGNSYGPVIRVNIERERRSGFIEYSDPGVAYEAVRHLHGFSIFGFPVAARIIDDLSAAPIPLSPTFPNPTNTDSGRQCDYRVLWLGNLCPGMTDDGILRMFQRFRPIHATVFEHSNSAFVNFANPADAAAAMKEMQGAKIKSWFMKIEYKMLK